MKRSSLVLLLVSSLSPLALAGCQTVEEDGYTYSDTYSRGGYEEDWVERPVYSDRTVVRRPPPVVYERPAPVYRPRPQYAAPQPQYQPPRPPPQYQPPPQQPQPYQPQPHRPPPPPPPSQPGPHGSDRGQPAPDDSWRPHSGPDIGR